MGRMRMGTRCGPGTPAPSPAGGLLPQGGSVRTPALSFSGIAGKPQHLQEPCIKGNIPGREKVFPTLRPVAAQHRPGSREVLTRTVGRTDGRQSSKHLGQLAWSGMTYRYACT